MFHRPPSFSRNCPSAPGRYPAVIVVMEAFGLNEHIKSVAKRIAGEGYVTLAPDMYYREKNAVVGYDESIRPPLREAVERLGPRSIALNFSESDPAADGLTHGLWLVLQETLAGSPFVERFVSAEPIVAALRGRKSPAEIERLRAAIRETEEIFEVVTASLRPGQSELEIAGLVHAEVERRGLGYAWGREHCPAVNAGPEKDVGHAPPGELRTRRGELLHMDFGVSREGYASDLQRVWYFLDEGEREAPEDVRRAWSALLAAMDAGAAALRPGVSGWEVDAAARESRRAAPDPAPQVAPGDPQHRPEAALPHQRQVFGRGGDVLEPRVGELGMDGARP